jgi:hypothetical protein
MPAGHVLYIHAEDDRDSIEQAFEWAGGDLDKWLSMPAMTQDDDPLNILDHLPEVSEIIRKYGIRFVVIDGQNSVVGAPRINTDMNARWYVTNKLHQFAQRENICLLGIRNEDREGRGLGPQSMGDIGRCVMRAVQVQKSPPYCVLEFVKVRKAARELYPDIPYSARDLGGSHAEIVWGKSIASDEAAKGPAAQKVFQKTGRLGAYVQAMKAGAE